MNQDAKELHYDSLKSLNESFLEIAAIDEDQIQHPQSILQNIVDRARTVLKADIIEFYEYFQGQNQFRVPPFQSGNYLIQGVVKDYVYEDDIMYELINKKHPLYIEDSSNTPNQFNKPYTVKRSHIPEKRFFCREKVQSLAVVPIRVGDETLGLMFTNYRKPEKFDEQKREFINAFAAQTAIVIKNTRLYHNLYQRHKIIHKIGTKLNFQMQSADEEKIFKIIYEEASDKLGIKNLSFATIDDSDQIHFRFAYSEDEALNEVVISKIKDRKGKNGKTGWVIKEQKPLLISSREELKSKQFESYFYNEGVSKGYSWLGVPMRLGEKVTGVLAAHGYDYDNAFTEQDAETLQALADMAAIARENVFLYRNLENRANELANEVSAERNLLSTVINNIPAYVYAKDIESRFKIANKEVAEIMGADDPQTLIDKTDHDYYPPEEADQFREDEKQIIDTGLPIRNKQEISKNVKGKKRVTLTTKVPWEDNRKNIIGTVGVGTDITELHDIQEKLEIEKNRFRAIINQIPDHIYLKDRQSRFVVANKTVLRHLGAGSFNNLIGKTDFDFHSEDYARQFFSVEQAIIAEKREPQRNENERLIDPATGKIRRLLTTKVPFKNEKGEIVGIVGVNRDITQAYRNYSLRRIAEAAYNAQNLDEFFGSTHEILKDILPADNFYVALHYPEEEIIRVPYFKDEYNINSDIEFSVNVGLAGYVFRTQKSFVGSSEELDELEQKGKIKRIGIKSKFWMGAPLTATRKIGVIAVQTYDDQAILDKKDLEVLTFVSHQIASAIERIMNQDEQEARFAERRKRLDALFDISLAARSSSSLIHLFEGIHDIVNNLMYVRNFYIALFNEIQETFDIPYFRDEYGDEKYPGDEVLKSGLAGYVLKNEEALLATPEIVQELIDKNEIKILRRYPVDWLGVPLIIRGRTIGVIVVQTYSEDHRYKESDKEVMVFVSEQIAMAIEQVRAKELQITALEKIAGSIIAPADLNEVINGILDTAQNLMDEAALCDIMLYDPKTDSLKIKWVRGKEGKTDFQVKIGEGITGWVAFTKEPYLSNDVTKDPYYKSIYKKTRSELAVPIVNQQENELIGVLNIEHHRLNAFDGDDKELAMALSHLAAIAIENKKMISEREALRELVDELSIIA